MFLYTCFGLVLKYLGGRETLTVVDAKAGLPASREKQVWTVVNLNPSQLLDGRGLDHPSVVSIEVVAVPQLAGLAHTFVVGEPLLIEDLNALVDIVTVAHKLQDRCNRGPRPILPRVAVHCYHSLFSTSEPIRSVLDQIIKHFEGRCMMVGPEEGGDSASEPFLRVVGRSLRAVDDPNVVSVSLLQKLGHIRRCVPVAGLNALGGVGHCNYVRSDVGEV